MGGGLVGTLGGTMDATFGRFELANGELAFIAQGEDVARWRVPCTQLVARHHGMLAMATVSLSGPMGTVRCNVSVERINRITENDLKTMRESRHAAGFVEAMHANGATAG